MLSARRWCFRDVPYPCDSCGKAYWSRRRRGIEGRGEAVPGRRAGDEGYIGGRTRAEFGQLFGAGSDVGLSDGELFGRFARRRDAAAEAAFQTLLARHGAMVLGVCHHVLGDAHAAEDAFQATFLILVRRAASLRVREPGSLGPWLHGVAYRTALKARREAAAAPGEGTSGRGAGGRAIPATRPLATSSRWCMRRSAGCRRSTAHRWCSATSRAGRTTRPPRSLRWPVGTVRGRLARARDLLRARLERRGLATLGPVVSVSPGPLFLPAPPRHLLEATAAFATEGRRRLAAG